MTATFSKEFTKAFKKLTLKTKDRFKSRLIIFELDEFDPVLNNHSLKGKYLGYRSINVTGDIRAIYRKNNTEVIFVVIDSHSNLYG